MLPLSARYGDFKCHACFDKGTRQIDCPDGKIGCAVFHTSTCDCEAGRALIEKAEFEKNQLSLELYSDMNVTINANSPFDTVGVYQSFGAHTSINPTKENK